MPIGTNRPVDRGVALRPPDMRVEHTEYFTTLPDPESDDPDLWLGFGAPTQYGQFLVPQRLILGVNGEPTTLALRLRLGTKTETAAQAGLSARIRPEEGSAHIHIGDRITLTQRQPGDHPKVFESLEWFRGLVVQERVLIQTMQDVEDYSIIAFGPEARLRGKVVEGQWTKTLAADNLHIAGTVNGVVTDVLQTNLPAVFNPRGQPNASAYVSGEAAGYDLAAAALIAPIPTDYKHNCRVFEPPNRKTYDTSGDQVVGTEHWDAYTALRSVVEWIDGYDVISPFTAWGHVKGLLEGVIISSVNIHGKTLLEAIRAILLPVGFGFFIVPWADSQDLKETGNLRHRLVVFSLTNPKYFVSPKLVPIWSTPPTVASSSGRSAEVQRLDVLQDGAHIANDVLVLGDQKRLGVTLYYQPSGSDLVPAWNTTTHALSTWWDAGSALVDPSMYPGAQATKEQFRRRYHTDGPDHPGYKHVFRTFVWNEDGWATGLNAGYSIPTLTLFGLGDDDNNVIRRPRPLGPSFLYDDGAAAVRYYPATIEMGIYEGGSVLAIDSDSWIKVPGELLRDRCGFTITRKTFSGKISEVWKPWAEAATEALKTKYAELHYLTLLNNTIRGAGQYRLLFRITGSIECDVATSGSATRELHSAWPYMAKRVVYAPQRFQWRGLRTAYSSGVSVDDPWGVGASRVDDRDDRDDAESYATAIRDRGQNAVGHGSLVLRFLTRAYLPGHGIKTTAGREVDMATDQGAARDPERAEDTHRWPIIAGIAWDFAEGGNKTELVLETAAVQVTR